MTDYICLIIGLDDTVLVVHPIRCPALPAGIAEATVLTAQVPGTRGYQLWAGGILVAAQLAKGGADWRAMRPEIRIDDT